jgi:hypothetical protein
MNDFTKSIENLLECEYSLREAVKLHELGIASTICETPTLTAANEVYQKIKTPDDIYIH